MSQFVAIDATTGEGKADWYLRAAHRIHGRVTDSDHRPIAGATVQTSASIYGEDVETDTDGRYLLDTIDPSLGRTCVSARHPNYLTAHAFVATSASDVAQDLVMEHGVEVRGVIVGPQSQVVPGAALVLGLERHNLELRAVSDLDGSFVFACVPPGAGALQVGRRGHARQRLPVMVPKAPADPVVVRVELEPSHFIGGVATGVNGEPFLGVSIAPRLNDGYLDGIGAETDARGASASTASQRSD